MQPKVSSALLKYVKPVATSEVATTGGRNVGQDSGSKNQNSSHKDQQAQPPQPEEFQRAQPPKHEPPVATVRESKRIPSGVTNAFLHLFQKFNFQRETLTRWLVRDQYENASKSKASGKLKKGSVLDKKSDS
jgi:hypothetical protein